MARLASALALALCARGLGAAGIDCDGANATSRRALAAASGDERAWRALGDCIEARRDARPAVLFTHISKAAGTSVCQVA